jgi:hypothetical protein
MRAWPRSSVVNGVIALFVLAPAGCGGRADSLPREPISGTVSFNGRPLKKGSIQFMPEVSVGGVATGGLIEDGRFRVDRDKGPVPGRYSVLIFASGDTEGPGDEGALPGRPKLPKKRTQGLIPPRYNFETKLVADVKVGGPNSFPFDLGP